MPFGFLYHRQAGGRGTPDEEGPPSDSVRANERANPAPRAITTRQKGGRHMPYVSSREDLCKYLYERLVMLLEACDYDGASKIMDIMGRCGLI